jgi:hypothetical protein
MALIAQGRLFSWEELNELGDLDRLRLVLEYMPDEELMNGLEGDRGRGRDEYPVRAVWNSIVAGVVFQHVSVESVRRELLRNGQLRKLCGFAPLKGEAAVPPAYVYTRFLKRVLAHGEMIDEMFKRLVARLSEALPGLGRVLAVDSKAIESHARRRKDEGSLDGRRELDADTGYKSYKGQREDGSMWEKVKKWFGFKLHLIVDAENELPVAYEVTKASESDLTGCKNLLGALSEERPELLARCEEMSGDKAYDDTDLIKSLWDDHGIKPVIDIRNMWKNGEETSVFNGWPNVVYDYKGVVYCHCPVTDERREMAFGGFEKDRETLKYRCPAKHYGVSCQGAAHCPVLGAVRIPLSEDRRIFTPLARSSYAWARAYKKRTAVERVNSRLDVSFGFEHHFIRGKKKMKLRVGLALCVMLAMALGRIKENQANYMRSLVYSKAA